MTGLRNTCVLEVDIQDDNGNTRTGVFQIQEELAPVGEITRQFLLGPRGEYLRQIYDIGSDLLPDDVAEGDLENRKGYHVDGGAGQLGQTITGKVGPGDSPWGDGSAATGEYSKYDASGDVPLAVKKQVLEWYLAQAASDSRGHTRLHLGEWTNGDYSDAAGVFGEPMPVAIPEVRIERPHDDPSGLDVTLECAWTAVFPEAAVEASQNAYDELAELIPDF